MHNLFLGIDVGTTNVKFGVIAAGNYIFQSKVKIRTSGKISKIRSQSASEILQIITTEIMKIPLEIRAEIQAISFSVAMHSLWPVNPENTNNDELYIWSDQQAADFIEKFQQTKQAQDFYLKTGTPIHAMSPFAKIKYFKTAKPELYPPETKWLGLKELLLNFFTGQLIVDYSTASATGLFNIHDLMWDSEILNYLGVTTNNLAKLVDCQTAFPLKKSVASALGLAPKAQVFPGASDGCLAAYAGLINSGSRDTLTIGTSAAVRRVSEQIQLNSQKQNFCYYLGPQSYLVGAPSNNGGIILDWSEKIFGKGDSSSFYQEISHALQESPVGANGAKFMPFINGERAPYWDANMRAEFKNISALTTRSDMIRAVVEGLLLNVRCLVDLVGVPRRISASGGFFKSNELAQITADIMGLDLEISEQNEPLAGLYNLITGQKIQINSKIKTQQIKYNHELKQRYEEILLTYFN